MRKYLLAGVAAAAIGGFALAPLAAHADTVSIGLQPTGTGTITLETSGNGSALFSGAGGNFTLNTVTGTGTPPEPQPNFSSTSLNATSTGAGTLKVYVSETSVTGPLGTYQILSGFSNSLLSSGLTLTQNTYVDPSDTVFGTTDPLDSATFTTVGSSSSVDATPNLTGPYSLTEVYTLVATAAGETSNATISIAAVPEPGSLALLGTALVGFGLLGWSFKKRRTA